MSGSLARALEHRAPPLGMLRDLQRLYDENPVAIEAFASAIANPSHSLILSMHFNNGRLAFVERREVAKT